MTPRAHQVLRRLHAAAIVAAAAAIAGVLLDQPRLALAAAIPVLFVAIISLEALRAAQGQQEKR